MHASHTIRSKGKSSRAGGCVHVCLRGDRQSEKRSAWSLQGDAGEDRLVGIKY